MVRGQRHAPAALYPRKRTGTHCTRDWVGHRAGLDRCGKSRPPPGFDPRTVQPVAQLLYRLSYPSSNKLCSYFTFGIYHDNLTSTPTVTAVFEHCRPEYPRTPLRNSTLAHGFRRCPCSSSCVHRHKFCLLTNPESWKWASSHTNKQTNCELRPCSDEREMNDNFFCAVDRSTSASACIRIPHHHSHTAT